MNQHVPMGADPVGMVNFLIGKAFPSPRFHPLPEGCHLVKGKVVNFIFPRVGKNDEGNSPLLLKFPHKGYLMGMDVVQGKGVRAAFLGIKADGNPWTAPM